jgi:hypothetical protein
MKNKKYFLMAIILFLFPGAVLAAYVDINVRESFYPGDDLKFSYRLLAAGNETVSYSPKIVCPNLPQAMLDEPRTIRLQPATPVYEEYSSGKVESTAVSETCEAQVEVFAPAPFLETKKFKIAGVKPLSAALNICADSDCKNSKTVFAAGEDVFLNLTADASDTSANILLTRPDGREEILTLPAKIKANEIGSYNISANIEKAGYQPVAINQNFAVIAEHLALPTTVETTKSSWLLIMIVSVAAILILVIIIFGAWLWRRNIKSKIITPTGQTGRI